MNRLAKTALLARDWKHVKEILNSYIYFKENSDEGCWGSVSEQDKKEIIRLVQKSAAIAGPIVEVGTLFGFTAQLIAAHKPADKELICVENFSWNPCFLTSADHRAFTERVLYYCSMHCNTRLESADKSTFYENYHGPRPSMIFIDALHEYDSVMEDLKWAKSLQIPIISGHDYCSKYPGVVQAVDETFGSRAAVEGWVWSSTEI
jgi:hypothetical protein